MPTPEELARQNIDAQLSVWEWAAQELDAVIEAILMRVGGCDRRL